MDKTVVDHQIWAVSPESMYSLCQHASSSPVMYLALIHSVGCAGPVCHSVWLTAWITPLSSCDGSLSRCHNAAEQIGAEWERLGNQKQCHPTDKPFGYVATLAFREWTSKECCPCCACSCLEDDCSITTEILLMCKQACSLNQQIWFVYNRFFF